MAVTRGVPCKEGDNIRFFNDLWLVKEQGMTWMELGGLCLKDYMRLLIMRGLQSKVGAAVVPTSQGFIKRSLV